MDSFLDIDLDQLDTLTLDAVLKRNIGPREVFIDHVWFYYKEVYDGEMTYEQFIELTDLLDPKCDIDLFEAMLSRKNIKDGFDMVMAYCLMSEIRDIKVLFTQTWSLRRKVKCSISKLIQLHNNINYDLCSAFIDAPINGDPDEFFSDPHPLLINSVIKCIKQLLTEPDVLTNLALLVGHNRNIILTNLIGVIDYNETKTHYYAISGIRDITSRICRQLIEHAIENNNYRVIEGLISMSIGKTREVALFDTNMVYEIATKAVSRRLDKILMLCLDIDMDATLIIKYSKLDICTDILKTDHIFNKRPIFNLFAILVHKLDFIGMLNVIRYYSVYFTPKFLQKVDWSSLKDHPKAIKMIAKRLGPKFFIPTFMTLFDEPGNLNFIRKYIKDLRYDINILDGQMLIAAAHSKNEQYIRWLLKHGADPNASNQMAYRLLSGNPLQTLIKDHKKFDGHKTIIIDSNPENKKDLMDLMVDEDPKELYEKIERETRPPSRQGFMF